WLQHQQSMKIRAPIWLAVIVVLALIALVLWHGKKEPAEMPVAVSPVTNVASPTVAATSSPVSVPVYSNTPPVAQVAASTSAPTPPMESKEQQMREQLA